MATKTPNTRNQPVGPGPHPMNENGAMRASIGTKIDTSLVPYELVAAAAVGLNYGAVKYGYHNFRKGLSMTQLLESIKRHIASIEACEEIDSDSGIPHWMLVCSSVAMMAHNIAQGKVIDDRPPLDSTLFHSIAEMSLRFKQTEREAAEARNENRA